MPGIIDLHDYQQKVTGIDPQSFEEFAFFLFKYQSKNNKVYANYIHQLGIEPKKVNALHELPFLPISFFKQHMIKTGDWNSQVVFESSGTTGQIRSRHHMKSLDHYHSVSLAGFRRYYGDPENYDILALLPSYLERDNSSLVEMARHLISLSKSENSGFYLDEYQRLAETLEKSKGGKRKRILLGVSFALWEFTEQYDVEDEDLIIMETGGMKGRRQELTRGELHRILGNGFGVQTIHSEYGMTELTSQAYSHGDGIFSSPPWMRMIQRDVKDPFDLVTNHRSGGINVIDLANVWTCAFIETEDIGTVNSDGSFQILGRMDNAEIRGCNLLVD